MRIDTNQEGLNCLYHPHTAKILQHLWDESAIIGDGVSIKDLHDWYNLSAQSWDLKKKSRTAILNAVEELERDKVIEHYEEPCQGGTRRMYYQAMSPFTFSTYVNDTLGDKVGEIFTGPWWKP